MAKKYVQAQVISIITSNLMNLRVDTPCFLTPISIAFLEDVWHVSGGYIAPGKRTASLSSVQHGR
jgi:hypothetical protein